MCGFAGAVDFGRGFDRPSLLEEMSGLLAHRGPDADGTWNEGPCGLAHRRLAVIDPDLSHQPMVSADGRTTLVFNGEIYNYRELRQELRTQGAPFTTQGDTEVLLHVIQRDGANGLDRLDGMYAFAAWDRGSRRLLLGRDPIGVKPLYVARPRPDLLVFGSQIRAVLAHPEVDGSVDEASMREVVRFRSVYGERTLYAGVRHLEPGTWLSFGPEGERTGRHFDLAARTSAEAASLASLTPDERDRRGRRLLEEAVEKRLVADVPVGAFLSGGIDSSLIVTVMQRLRGHKEVRTFSAGFANDPDTELPRARAFAEAVGTQHEEVLLNESDYEAGLTRLTRLRDAPLGESSDVAVAVMSDAARRSVKVVLSGEGGDEAFAGYPKYRFAATPWALAAGMRALGSNRASALGRRLGLDARRTWIAAHSLAQRREVDRLAAWFSYLDRATLTSLLPGLGWDDDAWLETRSAQARALGRFRGFGALSRMQGVDCLTWLPGNLLERGDRMTMSAGLEARVPYLDRNLLPYGLALDARAKVSGRRLKIPLRRWAAEQLPTPVQQHRKWGFRAPLEHWFRGGLRPCLRDHLLNPGGLCAQYGDRKVIEQLIDRHDAGRVDASMGLWTLLAVDVWYRLRAEFPRSGQ